MIRSTTNDVNLLYKLQQDTVFQTYDVPVNMSVWVLASEFDDKENIHQRLQVQPGVWIYQCATQSVREAEHLKR